MNPLRAWNTFWFRPISARPLGVFRIVVGLVALIHLAMLTVDLDYWLTDIGLLQGIDAVELAGPLRYSPLLRAQDPTTVHVFVAATAVVAGLVTLGWRTRVMSVVLYLMELSIYVRNIASNSGPDSLLMILIFLLMLTPSGASYSLDARRAARRRGGTVAEPLIAPWSVRLIQLQMSLIYLNTAILKSHGSSWLGGTALHYVINNRELRRLDFSFLNQYPVLLNVLTVGALLVEFGLAVFLWFRETRPWFLAAGLALHGGIALMVNAPFFGELMTACYLTFLTPGELDAILGALNPVRLLRRRSHARVEVPGRVDPAHTPDGPHASAGAHLPEVFSRSS